MEYFWAQLPPCLPKLLEFRGFLFYLFLSVHLKRLMFLSLCFLLLTKVLFQNLLIVGFHCPSTFLTPKLPSSLGLYDNRLLMGSALDVARDFACLEAGSEELLRNKGISGFLSGRSICMREIWCGFITLIGWPPISPLGAATSPLWLARFWSWNIYMRRSFIAASFFLCRSCSSCSELTCPVESITVRWFCCNR